MKRFLPSFLAAVCVAALPCLSRAGENTPVPSLSGQWGRAGLFRFEPPVSGPGPVTNRSRFPDTVERVGDYTNPILTPQSADHRQTARRRPARGRQLSRSAKPIAATEPPPFLLALEFEVQLIQEKDQVLILYIYGHQVRRIRLNGSHPAQHDTVCLWRFDRPLRRRHARGRHRWRQNRPAVDGRHFRNAAQRSSASIERYRLIDGEAASKTVPNARTPWGNTIDPDAGKNGLQVEFTVDGPRAFTMPWSARVTYRPLLGEWQEVVVRREQRNLLRL
jgi:hypothetical protein